MLRSGVGWGGGWRVVGGVGEMGEEGLASPRSQQQQALRIKGKVSTNMKKPKHVRCLGEVGSSSVAAAQD